MALTPMVLTARLIKKMHKNCKVVFIGPCSAKKLEASRRTIRSDVDFVLTFEELMGMFAAKNIDPETVEVDPNVLRDNPLGLATAAGRGFAVSNGVASAVADVIREIDPDREVKIMSAQGLRDCKKMLTLAKAGKYDGYLWKGWAAPADVSPAPGRLPRPPSRRRWSPSTPRRRKAKSRLTTLIRLLLTVWTNWYNKNRWEFSQRFFHVVTDSEALLSRFQRRRWRRSPQKSQSSSPPRHRRYPKCCG